MNGELIRVSEFCARFAISRATFYRLVGRGEIEIVKIGAGTRIRACDAARWLASLPS